MIPLPLDALTFNPPNSWVAPIFPVKVTVPVPEVIVKTSSSPPPLSIAPPKVTFPIPVPVSIVVTTSSPSPSKERSTPAVLKAILSLVVVKVAPSPVISIF